MIKKILAVLAVVAMALPVCSMAQSKFGIVNPDAIMRDLPELAKAQKELEAVSAKYQKEDSVLQTEIQLKYDDLQKTMRNDPNTPQAIQERRMQEIQDMTNKYQQFRQNAQQDIQRQQETLLAPVQQKVVSAIKAVGELGSYTFIFTSEVPAYVGKDVVDVTPEVRKQLGLK
ncbi:MAG: OmpH family outer membrane protein [Candidatus Amulumruptor sp.]|jgi:cationic outer membrane protein ompH